MTDHIPARPAPVREDSPVEGEVLTPRQKLEGRRQVQADRGLAPRRPGDRQKPQKEKPRALGKERIDVEFDGFIYSVDPSVLDDWELLEAESDGVLEEMSLIDQYRAMLGDAGYEELKANVRETYGYVSGRIMGGFMAAVQDQVDSGN